MVPLRRVDLRGQLDLDLTRRLNDLDEIFAASSIWISRDG